MRVITIDDEKNSRQLMSTLIKNYCKEVDSVFVGDSVASGIQLINEVNPHLLFLDIEMQEENGFDLLDNFKEANFLVCFATGYEKYALKAIQYGAFAYLLKPIDLTALQDVVKKATKHFDKLKLPDNHNSLWINDGNSTWQIDMDSIVQIEAFGNYTNVVLDDKSVLSNEKLTFFEELLPENKFFRVHRSHIINLSKAIKVEEGRTGKVHLSNKAIIPVANRRMKPFQLKIKDIIS